MSANFKVGIGVAVILAAFGWLAATGFEEGKAYYRTVDEVVADASLTPAVRLKISGEVVPGSILRDAEGLHFRLSENGAEMAVTYTGSDPVPDTFKDLALAVVEGRLRGDGGFAAEKIQAKCASKYEALYGEEENAA